MQCDEALLHVRAGTHLFSAANQHSHGAATDVLELRDEESGESPSREFRDEAAITLAYFGPEAKEAVPSLIDMFATS
jgi:hypothetical protein